jgi:hypothetical protein
MGWQPCGRRIQEQERNRNKGGRNKGEGEGEGEGEGDVPLVSLCAVRTLGDASSPRRSCVDFALLVLLLFGDLEICDDPQPACGGDSEMLSNLPRSWTLGSRTNKYTKIPSQAQSSTHRIGRRMEGRMELNFLEQLSCLRMTAVHRLIRAVFLLSACQAWSV